MTQKTSLSQNMPAIKNRISLINQFQNHDLHCCRVWGVGVVELSSLFPNRLLFSWNELGFCFTANSISLVFLSSSSNMFTAFCVTGISLHPLHTPPFCTCFTAPILQLLFPFSFAQFVLRWNFLHCSLAISSDIISFRQICCFRICCCPVTLLIACSWNFLRVNIDDVIRVRRFRQELLLWADLFENGLGLERRKKGRSISIKLHCYVLFSPAVLQMTSPKSIKKHTHKNISNLRSGIFKPVQLIKVLECVWGVGGCKCMYEGVYMWVCVHIYICVCVCVCVCVHIWKCMHDLFLFIYCCFIEPLVYSDPSVLSLQAQSIAVWTTGSFNTKDRLKPV